MNTINYELFNILFIFSKENNLRSVLSGGSMTSSGRRVKAATMAKLVDLIAHSQVPRTSAPYGDQGSLSCGQGSLMPATQHLCSCPATPGGRPCPVLRHVLHLAGLRRSHPPPVRTNPRATAKQTLLLLVVNS